ncbi:DoxX family protein [Massilia sp. W12]|uniref:DoxX family protein n=1 Tax=Massilia sp. W12 TaxID=3126507 RepID=UPI0030D02BFE
MRNKKYVLLIASILLALITGAGGVMKLMGVPAAHASFGVLGLPAWFGYFIGLCETLGAIALFIPALSALAAGGLSVIMCGALYFHIVHTPLAQGVPALIALLLAGYIALSTRGRILQFKQA